MVVKTALYEEFVTVNKEYVAGVNENTETIYILYRESYLSNLNGAITKDTDVKDLVYTQYISALLKFGETIEVTSAAGDKTKFFWLTLAQHNNILQGV